MADVNSNRQWLIYIYGDDSENWKCQKLWVHKKSEKVPSKKRNYSIIQNRIMPMSAKILLAVFALIFVPVANAFAICPIVGVFAPPARTRVTIVHQYAAPVVTYRAAPVVSVVEAPAPDVEYVSPQPTVVYRQRTVYRSAPVMVAAPTVGVAVEAGQTGAQRRHAKKSVNHAKKAAEHVAKSAYWASRS